MQWLSFALLGVALVALLISTRQFPWKARLAFWGAGAALLVGAAVAALAQPGHAGLIAMLGGVAGGDHIALRAVPRDLAAITSAIAPTIDLFLLLGAALAIVALIAFTPGEKTEQIIRPIMIGVFGAIFGALVAFSLVGTGFAGAIPNQFYLSNAADVYDGDTLRLGDVSVRLASVDAPERRQTCISPEALPWQCGEDARQHLISLTHGATVMCKPLENATPDAFGPPAAQCFATIAGGAEFDLGRRMVEDGYAAIYPDAGGPDYDILFQTAQAQRKGIFSNCTLAPSEWRNNAAARIAFEALSPGILPGAPTLGACDALKTKPGKRPS
jgi:endonuclease YncB( thermonuclease family)